MPTGVYKRYPGSKPAATVRPCRWCQARIVITSRNPEQRFCCKAHASQWQHRVRNRECRLCKAPIRITSKNPDQRFCCVSHSRAWQGQMTSNGKPRGCRQDGGAVRKHKHCTYRHCRWCKTLIEITSRNREQQCCCVSHAQLWLHSMTKDGKPRKCALDRKALASMPTSQMGLLEHDVFRKRS